MENAGVGRIHYTHVTTAKSVPSGQAFPSRYHKLGVLYSELTKQVTTNYTTLTKLKSTVALVGFTSWDVYY